MMSIRLIALLSVLYLCSAGAWAQADRHYVHVDAAYVSASGALVDSAHFRASTSYAAGYQWAPSRILSVGVLGWYTPGDVLSSHPASVFGMHAAAMVRLFKHGFTPYASAEAGFGFLSLPDSLVGSVHLDPQLGFSVAGSAGFLIPVSSTVEIDAAARYVSTSVGDGLVQLQGVVGLRYRLR